MLIKTTTMTAMALAMAIFAGTASAQKITLRVGDHYPVGAPTAQYTAKFFIDTVTKAAGDQVAFEYYPAEQLGKAKDMLNLAQSGVIDISMAAPSYISDKMPLSGVAELPGLFTGSCEGTMAYWRLAREGGLLAQKEFQPNGVRVVLADVLPPYQIFTKTKFEKLADLKGQKLRSGGGAMDLTVRRLDAVPVRLAGPDVYESLARGTLDGLVFPFAATLQFNLQDNIKYATIGENFGGFAVVYVMSEAKWRQLSPTLQKAMTEAGEATTRHACAMGERDIQPAIDKLRERGVQMVTLSAADKATLKTTLEPVHRDWAEALDKRGRPGTEVLDAFNKAVAGGS